MQPQNLPHDLLNIGVIGLGSIGLRMLAAFAEHQTLNALVAWDPSDAACAAARQRFPALRIADHADAVIHDAGVELIYVACPPNLHAQYALATADVGKALLCEKPLGINVTESEALVASLRGRMPQAVNFLLAAARSADYVVQQSQDGQLGALRSVEVHLHLPGWAARRYAEAPWLAKREAGGFLREVGSHFVYFARRLLGELTCTVSEIRYASDHDDAETNVFAVFDGAGVPVTLRGSTVGHGDDLNHCIVSGDKASYRIRDFHNLDVATPEGWVPIYDAPAHPERETHLRQCDRVVDMMRGKTGTTASLADALAVQHMVESMHTGASYRYTRA